MDTNIEWESIMEDEMDSLLRNKTWDLCKLPASKWDLQNKWVYRFKGDDGSKKHLMLG